MFRQFNNRAGHYILLLTVTAALCFPNLGAPSLWDIDEGNNAEAAREMLRSENCIVPKFNGELRVDKPAFLYWLQIGAYRLFGINEFSARFPSAMATILAVLITYELGRRLFAVMTGLLGGLILASTVAFCGAGHFANPDALLNALTALSLLCIWKGLASARVNGWSCSAWFLLAGVSEGLGMLTKGPVGLLFPMAITGLYLLLSWQPRQLFNSRLLLGGLTFVLVSLPWYARVAEETKNEFLKGFFLTHNIDRALAPMENHRGAAYYYLVVFLVGFAPWSSFLCLAGWNSAREWLADPGWQRVIRAPFVFLKNVWSWICHPRLPRIKLSSLTPLALWNSSIRCLAAWTAPCAVPEPGSEKYFSRSHIFLWCWISLYVGLFTMAGTKLPNYILPMYPAMAILLARFLDRWLTCKVVLAGWALGIGLTCFAFTGLALSIGLLVVGGWFDLPFYTRQHVPGVTLWAALGLIPLAGVASAWWYHRRQRTDGVVASIITASVLLIGLLAAGPGRVFNDYKAPRALALSVHDAQTEREVRVGCYQYFQPSLVFYCQRKVDQLQDEEQTIDYLRSPLPVYVCLPASAWEGMQGRVDCPCHVLARQRDLYRKFDVLVVSNR